MSRIILLLPLPRDNTYDSREIVLLCIICINFICKGGEEIQP